MASRTKRVLLGFAFEGCGISTAKSAGICLHDSAHPAPASSSYEWIPALAVTPSGLDTTINPYTGDWAVSSYTVDISGSDRMRALFFTEQHTPSGALDSALTSTAATVPYDVPGLAGQVIWVNDEAILLGTYSSGVGYTSSTRAYWGTSRQFHIAGSYVYEDATPYWESRLVTMVEHDLSDGTETVRWRGLITDMRTDESGARITIETIEILGALRDAQTNLDAVDWVPVGSPRYGFSKLFVAEWEPQVVRGSTTALMQVGDNFIAGATLNSEGTGLLVPLSGTSGITQSELELEGKLPSKVYEVCMLSSFATLPEPAHPVAICLALLTSTGKGHNGDYDILTERFGLGIDYLDFTRWTDAITAYPDLTIDRLLLGWNGEPVDVLQEAQKILRVFGFFITVTSTGLLGLARLRLFDISDIETAQATTIYPDGPLQWLRSFGSAAKEVVAIVGGLPWEKTSRLTIREARRSRRTALLGDARTYDLDLSVLDPSRLEISDRESSLLSTSLASMLFLGIDAAPRLRVRVPDYRMSSTLTSLDLGDLIVIPSVEVEDGWLLDPEGNLVEDGDDLRFYGMLVGRLWDAVNHTYTLELILMNYRVNNYARLRAPAAVVDAWDAGGLLLTLDGTEYGAGSNPASQFEAGDEVTLWNADGTLYASGFHVVDVPNGDELELNVAPVPAPKAGVVLRVAASDVFDNDSRYSGIKRPWAYAAPADGDFDDADGNSTSDIYGTNTITVAGNDRTANFSFIGLDEDAITATGDSAQPLDAFVEWTLLDQMSWLIEEGYKVTWAPRTSNGGSYSTYTNERPMTSISRTYPCYWPWYFERGQNVLDVGGIVRIADPSGNSMGCDVTVHVGGGVPGTTLDKVVRLTNTNTEASTPQFQGVSKEITFDARERLEVGPVAIGITSERDDTTDIKSIATIAGLASRYGTYEDTTASSTFFQDTAAARPNAAALDLQFLEEGGERGDILYRKSDSIAVLYPPVRDYYNFDTNLRHMTYAQIRSLELRNGFEDTTRMDRAHRGGVPLLAETEASHFVRTHNHYKRRRPLWVGPTWETPTEAGWPNGYTRRFIRVAGDATETAVLEANVWPSTVNPEIEVLAYVFAYHYSPLFTPSPLLGYERERAAIHAMEDTATLASWDAWVTAERIEDGDSDWSAPAEVAAAPVDKAYVDFTHILPDSDHSLPILLQEYRHQEDSGGFIFKEGQLFEPDLGVLQLVRVKTTATHDPSSNEPCRVRLHLDLSDIPVDYGEEPTDRGGVFQQPANNDVANLHLAIVGVTIWEAPQ